jgi:hypothetical protein
MTDEREPEPRQDELLARLGPEAGWIDDLRHDPRTPGRSFVRRDTDPERYRVRYYRRAFDGALVGKAWLGPGCQGPPGHAHGGSSAALLDDAMGCSAWMRGHAVLAGEITIRFRRPMPLSTIVFVEARIVAVEGPLVRTESALRSADGEDGVTFVSGKGTFHEIGAERFEALLGAARPR